MKISLSFLNHTITLTDSGLLEDPTGKCAQLPPATTLRMGDYRSLESFALHEAGMYWAQIELARYGGDSSFHAELDFAFLSHAATSFEELALLANVDTRFTIAMLEHFIEPEDGGLSLDQIYKIMNR